MSREFTPTFDSFFRMLKEVEGGNRNCIPIEIVQSLCQRSTPWDAQRIALSAIENSHAIEYFDQNSLDVYVGVVDRSINSNGNGH